MQTEAITLEGGVCVAILVRKAGITSTPADTIKTVTLPSGAVTYQTVRPLPVTGTI